MLSQIVSGAWKAGDQLPTEKALCAMLGISRSTVRAAIQSLVRDGLVVRSPGKGSFVTSRPTTQITVPPLGFHRTMTARGYAVRNQILERSIHPATKDLIEVLNLHNNAEILYVHRLRYLNDRPVALARNYVVYDLVRGIEETDLGTGSLWAALEQRLGRQVSGGIHTFYAVQPTEQEKGLLQLPESIPLLMSIGTNYLEDGTAFERAEVRIPGDCGFLVARHVTESISFPDSATMSRERLQG
jgi:GntR family transcriptional regulator